LPGIKKIDLEKCAKFYIEEAIRFGGEGNPVRKKIRDVDCVIYDFPEYVQIPGFLLRSYVVKFYIPEHKRVYGIRWQAFWEKGARHPYDPTKTPAIMEKAVVDFVNLNR